MLGNITNTIGPLLIGLMMSLIFHGVTVVFQVMMAYQIDLLQVLKEV